MTKKPNKLGKNIPNEKNLQATKLPINELFPVKSFVKVDDETVEKRRLVELTELLWITASMTLEDVETRILRAVELYESLKPVDGAESMLAVQMVGTHTAALECLQLAAVSGQSIAGRDMALKNANKLMALYTKQLEALNKQRDKGQQKVTVGHVNVASGGQAIVGNVNTGNRLAKSNQTSIDHNPEMPLPKVHPAKTATSKRPRK